MAKGKYQEWLTPEGLLKIEGWARDGLTDEQIAQNIGVTATTLYEWKKRFPEISEALKRGKEVIDRQVENALLKRALGYAYTEVTRERIKDTGQKQRHEGAQELTEKEWEFAKLYFGGECCYCGEHRELTKDHLNPLNNGGALSRENVVPCCKSCNSSKRDREWMSWYKKQPFYDVARLRKIQEYIDFVQELQDLEPEPGDTGKMVITKEVTKQVVPDTTAQIFWLKNRKPEAWRDKPMPDQKDELQDDGFLEALKGEAEKLWQDD